MASTSDTTKQLTILVSGRNGQLGSELYDVRHAYPNIHLVVCTREQLPIADKESVRQSFEQYQPDYFINCAAYTAVDKAEEEKSAAYAVNAEAPGFIASLCAEFNCRFIHISTDYVFDGNGNAPLKEDHPVHPINSYGASKLEGERLVMKNNPDSIIIRTSWVYSFYGKNFVKTMMRLMRERPSINVVADQVGSPTYAADLAHDILQIIHSGKWTPGIYHYSNEGTISWFDFAVAIKEELNAACAVNPITTDQFPTPAKRPSWSVMDKSKIRETFGLVIPDWKESLHRCMMKLKQ